MSEFFSSMGGDSTIWTCSFTCDVAVEWQQSGRLVLSVHEHGRIQKIQNGGWGGGANLDIAYTFCGKTLTKISTLEEEFFKNWKTVLKSFNKDSIAASDMENIDCQSINIVQINCAKIVLQSLTDTTSFFVSHLYINIKNRFCYIITYIATILF